MTELTQRELEQPAKVYQVEGLRKDIHNIEQKLDNAVVSIEQTMSSILTNTKGVVTYGQMEKYVDKRIDEKIHEFKLFKRNAVKLGWMIVALLLADIATRLLK